MTYNRKTKIHNKNMGIELLRILCMFMIIILHLLYKGGILHGEDISPAISNQAWLLEAFCYVAVNCYVMISGWLLAEKTQNTKGRIAEIWIRTFVYSAIIGTISFFVFPEVKKMLLVKSYLPVISNSYWFITNYLILYMLVPFINKVVQALEKKDYQKLLVFLFVVFSLWPNVVPFFETVDETNGYSIVWFIYLYLVGAYIKLHGEFKKKSFFYGMGYLGCSILVFASRLIVLFLEKYVGFFAYYTFSFYSYNSILVFGASVCLFILFSRGFQGLQEKEKLCAGILFFSEVTLDVYLIHEQVILREHLWERVIPVAQIDNGWGFIPMVLLVAAVVFVVCCIVGRLVQCLFKIKPVFGKILKKSKE